MTPARRSDLSSTAPQTRPPAAGCCRQSGNLLSVAAFLAARGAEFVVVGGCALLLHGRDHVPGDLDLVPEPSAANLGRLFDALDALGSVGRVGRPTDHVLATRDIVTRVTPVGAVDVLLRRGRADHTALARTAVSIPVGRHAVRVASIADVVRLRLRFGKDMAGA